MFQLLLDCSHQRIKCSIKDRSPEDIFEAKILDAPIKSILEKEEYWWEKKVLSLLVGLSLHHISTNGKDSTKSLKTLGSSIACDFCERSIKLSNIALRLPNNNILASLTLVTKSKISDQKGVCELWGAYTPNQCQWLTSPEPLKNYRFPLGIQSFLLQLPGAVPCNTYHNSSWSRSPWSMINLSTKQIVSTSTLLPLRCVSWQ